MDAAQSIVASIYFRVINETEAGIASVNAQLEGVKARAAETEASLSKVSIVVGALSAGFLAFAADGAIKFQGSMDQVRNQSLLSEDQIHSLSDAVLKLGPDIAQTPEALSTALLDVAKTGYSGATALEILSDSGKQAAISHIELATAESTVVSVLKAHLVGVNSVHDATVQLNAITQTSRVTYDQLSTSLKTGMLSALQATGLGLKDLGAAIGTMADSGVVGNRALMSLRTVLLQMEDPPKKLADALQTVGISQNQLADDMRSGGIVQAMSDLKSHMEAAGLSSQQQSQLIVQAFGQGAKAILPMIENLDDLKKHYADQSGAAAKFAGDWQAAQQTVEFRLKDLRATFDALSVEVGTVLLPAINDVLQPFLLIGRAVFDVSSAFPGLTAGLLAGAVALGGFELAVRGGKAAVDFYRLAVVDLFGYMDRTATIVSRSVQAVRDLGDAEAAAAVKTQLLTAAEGEQVVANSALTASSLASAGEVAGLGTVVQRASGLFVPMRAAAGEAAVGTEALGAEAAGATGMLGSLGGAVGLLLQPEVGIPALAAILGVVAYEKSPALREEVGQLKDRLGTDLYGAEVLVTGGFRDMGNAMGWVGTQMDALGVKAGTLISDLKAGLSGAAAGSGGGGFLGGALQGFVSGVADAIPGLKDLAQIEQFFHDLGAQQQTVNEKTAEGAKAVNALTSAHLTLANRAHAGWVQIDQDASKYFSDLQSGASKASDALAEAIAKGAPQSQINQLLGEAVQKTNEYARAQEAEARAQQLINARLGDTVGSYNRVKEALSSLTAEANRNAQVMAGQVAAQVKSMADRSIADAKRMSDGMIAEIDRVKAELAKPLPELKLAPLSTFTDNSSPGGDFGTIPHGTAQNALELSAAAEKSFSELTSAINGLPPAYRSMMSGVEGDFESKMKSLYDGLVDKENAENRRHEAALTQIHDTFNERVKSLYDAAASKEDSLYQTYLARLKTDNDNFVVKMQGVLQQFEVSFQQLLVNYQSAESAASQKIAGDQQAFSERLTQIHDSFLARLESIHGKNADEQRTLLEESYNRQVAAADYSYRRQLDADQRHADSLTAAFNQHVSSMKTALQEKVDGDRKAYDDEIKRLDDALRTHETRIAADLKKHVDDLHKTLLEDKIRAEDSKHAGIMSDLLTRFEQSASKLASALEKKDLSPDKILSTLQSQSEAQYKKALEAATVSILLHGHATQAEIEALQRAASVRDRLSAAEAKAEQISNTSATAHASATKAVLDFKTALDQASSRVQADSDKIAQLIFSGQGNLPGALPANEQAANRMAAKAGLDEPYQSSTRLDQAIQTLISDYEKEAKLKEIETEAQLKAAKATGDWATVLQITENQIKGQLDGALAHLTMDLLNHSGNIGRDTYALQVAAAQQEKLTLAQQRANDILVAAEIKAAIAAGDLAGAAKLTSQKISDDLAKATDTLTESFYLNGSATQSQIAAAQQAAAEQQKWVLAQQQADIALGNFDKALSSVQSQLDTDVKNAFAKIALEILNHQQVTAADVDSLKEAKQRQDDFNSALVQAYVAAGDLADAFDQMSSTASKQLDDAEKQYAYDLLNHTGNLQADTQAIIRAKTAVDGFTSAMNQAKAIADSTGTPSLSSVQSAQDAVAKADLDVIAAQTTVMAGEMAAQTDAINGLATSIKDEASVVDAQAGVDSALADGQIKAIQDGTEILKAQYAIQQATDPLSLQIARAQLKLAEDKAAADRRDAQFAVAVARMGVQIASDKMAADAADAAAKMAVDSASLKVDLDKLKLAQDSLKLAEDQLHVLGNIDAALNGMTDAEQLLASDQGQIQADQRQEAMDEQALQMAQSMASQIQAMGSLMEANDDLQLAELKREQTDANLQGQLQEASDQAHIDSLQMQQQASQNSQSIVDAINATKAELAADLEKLHELSEEGLGLARINVAGVGTSDMMNGWASVSARQVTSPV